MSALSPTNTIKFERWLLDNHPVLFSEWELEYCEYLELDDWLWQEHPDVLYEWWAESEVIEK